MADIAPRAWSRPVTGAGLALRVQNSNCRHFDPRSTRILLVEAGPRILPTFSERLAERARRELVRLGVTVCAGQAVEQVDATGVTIASQHIAAGTVLWAAGVMASPAAQWLGVTPDRAGRVVVEPTLTVPDHPEI